jgi:hypothetical protein
VAIYRYVTEGSFDAYMWQALETKARFIGQFMTGDNAARRAEDIGSQELSYAEVKAIASSNPAVLTLAEADAELQRLNLLEKNHLDEQYIARRSVQGLPATIASLSDRLSRLTKDAVTAADHAGDRIEIAGRAYPHDDIPAVLGKRLETLPKHSQQTTSVPLGAYRGLRFGIVLHPDFPAGVYLEGATTRQTGLSRDHQGARAVLNALERLADGYGPECSRVERDLGIAESQLRDFQARLGKPFPHDRYLSQLTDLRDQLKTGLSATGHEANADGKPDVSELADRIKALKAAHTIEATPQRMQSTQVTAEEPITARIRKRQEANSASHQAGDPEVATELPALQPPASRDILSARPPVTFQDQIATERFQQDQQPSLP